MASPETSTIAVRVAFSPKPGEVDELELRLPVGASVDTALQASGLAQRHPGIDLSALAVGVWGKVRARGDALRDADRVEVYRPLQVDPKEARRLRYKAHLAKFPKR